MKTPLESKTIQGGIGVAVSQIVIMLGSFFPQYTEQIEMAGKIALALSSLWTIYGFRCAKEPIGFKKNPQDNMVKAENYTPAVDPDYDDNFPNGKDVEDLSSVEEASMAKGYQSTEEL